MAITSLMKLKLEIYSYIFLQDLFSTKRRFVKEELFTNAAEETYANALSTVVKEFPNVSFGSYPVSNCR